MLKTDENRNCNFAFPVFDLRRSFKPEVILEVDEVIKIGLEENFIFFLNFAVAKKLKELRRFLILTFAVTLTFDLWPWKEIVMELQSRYICWLILVKISQRVRVLSVIL